MPSKKYLYDNKTKIIAREETIIKEVKRVFGSHVPNQYWTLCGPHTNESGNIRPRSELAQIEHANILPYLQNQFHGVDLKPEIIEDANKARPDLKWVNDDILLAMQKSHAKGEFNPSVINLDFINMHRIACGIFADVIHFLTDEKEFYPLLVIANIITASPYKGEGHSINEVEKEANYFLETLNSKPYEYFRIAMDTGNWNLDKYHYTYPGSGKKGHTYMSTFLLTKTTPNKYEEAA